MLEIAADRRVRLGAGLHADRPGLQHLSGAAGGGAGFDRRDQGRVIGVISGVPAQSRAAISSMWRSMSAGSS